MIVNRYKRGEGIVDHVDLLRFCDGIVGLSLVSTCVMDLKPCNQKINHKHQVANYAHDSTHFQCHNDSKNQQEMEDVKSVFLSPGDLYLMHGNARYNYTHGIPGQDADLFDGIFVPRKERISVTLRSVCL
eukprot:TRINITY_DN4439_c0_g1_i1.p1 TRINITY_DN4439_c0_g1~~TRINITY_DN4439_c0_g1_i1.p1  ORF type:complete len:130 (-),score=13.41 TRINITY_DN4439_c0_g1_i1:170-559(-)